MLLKLIVFLPLISFIAVGLFGNRLGGAASGFVASLLLTLSAFLAWILFLVGGYESGATVYELASWLQIEKLNLVWSLRLDSLTATMAVVVTTVSSLVHIYSIGYMSHDPDRPRFFAYLSLFTFAMLMLVTANDFGQLFFGWEGVGLASYLLIGFWYKKPSACGAAIKAFVVNRVGDFGFILGICAVFLVFGRLDFAGVFAAAETVSQQNLHFLWFEGNAITIICVLLFIGAMGKSAQIILHTWLPDAMEGPTPVSALIHAATMVTAGIFMVARLSPLFAHSPTALTFITIIGATTAFFAATVALVQNDIKRVIAYSTCSQLGYMIAALGVGAYSLAMFHLFTHAFFKALLFLGSGSVIHAVNDEQDMRKMGGLSRAMPWTYLSMLIGTLALTGVGLPFTILGFAGFVSKDAIIESVFAGGYGAPQYAFALLIVSALFTSFYSWRLIHMTFNGRSRIMPEILAHVHEAPRVMLIPLFVLAFGSLVVGTLFYSLFVGDGLAGFMGAILPPDFMTIVEEMHHSPWWVVLSPTLLMVVGFVTAYYFYIIAPEVPKRLAKTNSLLYRFLLNKWYFDELYQLIFVRPVLFLAGFLWHNGDERAINRFGPDGVALATLAITRRAVKMQTGYIYHYAFAMLIGLSLFVTWIMFFG